MTRPVLVIFAKAPVIGGAKTRLARGIGKVSAWRLYRAMTARLMRRLADRRWDTVLAVAPDAALKRCFPGVWPPGVKRRAQGPGDLGARQARVFSGRGPVCVIGSDAPDVTRADIASAFKALKRHDAVTGPALDGGYWLLALNAPAPRGLFEGVRWSHAQTLSDLEARLAAHGLSVARLRALADVDEAGDLRRQNRPASP
ncbi:glycosyltransferase [Alkalicaulis satelles]|uniref:Glycosyltransferase n=1 Tax=Alkalicaulis satelles TaxID=2609175 RepID=A0A5M6ZNT3_9PROT|nr:TIGR04282 family arsenosugar biosynthesis glycosyltransferase [Alkalicaulis satelles]KAA5805234.1 glycosyltransferase [Alkalicaulis satelles]